MAKSALSSSGISAAANSATTYYIVLALSGISFETTEANAQITYRTAGTLSDIYAKVTANTLSGGTGASTVRVRLNASNGTQVVSVNNGSTGEFTDATPTNTDTVAATDKVNYSLVTGGTSGTIFLRHLVTNFAPSANVFAQYASINQTAQADATTNYWGLSGSIGNNNTTEARASMELNSGNVTFQNLFCYVSQNDIGVGQNTTVAFRDDGVSAISLSASGNTTGIFEETATSTTPATNSLINFLTTVPSVAGAHTVTFEIISIGGTSSDSKYFSPTDDSNGAVNAASTTYFNLDGRGVTDTTVGILQRSLRIAADISNAVINISANAASGTSTFAINVGGSDTSVSASIATTLTGNFENTGSTSVTSAQLICYALTAGGTGNLTSRSMCCMITNTEASGPANLKSYNTNVKSNIKSIDTNLLANIKSLDTNI